MVTYLVVLLQFQISIPDEPSAGGDDAEEEPVYVEAKPKSENAQAEGDSKEQEVAK